jgi:hypothetical protein
LPRRGAVDSQLPMVVPPDIDGLPPAELRQLLLKLREENAELKRRNAELSEEIARLKGLKGRPSIKPSGMENGTSPKPGGKRARRRRRGKIVPRVEVEEQILKAEVPEGSRFKGYEDFVVQDLEVRVRVIRYRRERWVTPDGRTLIAPLPSEVRGGSVSVHARPQFRGRFCPGMIAPGGGSKADGMRRMRRGGDFGAT